MSVAHSSPPQVSGPAWDVARLFPDQGYWGEGDYLWLTENVRYAVELVDGVVEVLPMPTASHQNIVIFLFTMLRAYIASRKLGYALQSPFRVRLGPNHFREPDVCFMQRQNASRMSDEYWEGADLVMEVVSNDPKDRARDLGIKREAYARAGVREYWIVDPKENRIEVLRLEGNAYVTHADAGAGGRVASILLPGFECDVDAVMAAASFPE